MPERVLEGISAVHRWLSPNRTYPPVGLLSSRLRILWAGCPGFQASMMQNGRGRHKATEKASAAVDFLAKEKARCQNVLLERVGFVLRICDVLLVQQQAWGVRGARDARGPDVQLSTGSTRPAAGVTRFPPRGGTGQRYHRPRISLCCTTVALSRCRSLLDA